LQQFKVNLVDDGGGSLYNVKNKEVSLKMGLGSRIQKLRIDNGLTQQIHLGSIYLIVRDFEKAVSFYENLLSMTVSTRNCGNKFAEFYFDNKCLALMNEANLHGHHYTDGDYKFVLNFWVEDLKMEYERLKKADIGRMTEIRKVNEGYYYFHIIDPDNNVCEVTGEYNQTEEKENG